MAEPLFPPPTPEPAPDRHRHRVRRTRFRRTIATAATALGVLAATVVMRPASAADNPYQRGPDPTLASVAATRGTFATAQMSVPPGNGFNGGMIYYPTDTSRGTFAALAIVPGYSALFSVEEAWMGPWLASFGFVVIGIETNSRTDGADPRATQLLAALDYLTQRSTVRDRIDSSRLTVMGHSAGGAGALTAALRRPSLKTVVGLAPGAPGGGLSLANLHMPTMFIGGQRDTAVTPAYLNGLWTSLPSSTQRAWVELANADHLAFTRPNPTEMRVLIPWLKIFLDNDTRYTQFLCPLADSTGISNYRSSCPLVPPGGPTPPTTTPTTAPPTTAPPTTAPPTTAPPTTAPPTTAPPTTAPPTTAPPTTAPPTTAPPTTAPTTTPPTGAACHATYRAVGSWPGGFQGEVTVTAGNSAITGWTVRWALANGQSISQVWNGTLTVRSSSVTVTNASYNGVLQASASTTFGFIGTGTASVPALTCALS